MAKKVQKNTLFGKVGNKLVKAHQAHKSDETRFDTGTRLPDGIEGGVARLVDCKFGTYENGDNKGEFFFYAAGVVVAPKEHNGVPIEGLRTSIMEPLHDTPTRARKTFDEHLDWVYNELRKLGIDTDSIDIESNETALEDTAAALVAAAPCFRFRTWKGKATEQYPDPRVNEVWGGAVDYNEENSDDIQEDDSSDSKPKEAAPEEGTEDEGSGDEGGDDDSTTSSGEEGEESNDVIAIRNLGDAADEGDNDSAEKLDKIAREKGLDPDQSPTWKDLANAVVEAMEGGEDSEGTESDWEPEVNGVYKYKAPGNKKASEVVVTQVFKDKKLVNLKDNVNKKLIYKGVSWDSLEQAE